MKFVFALLYFIITIDCTIYVRKEQFEPEIVEIPKEEYEENNAESFLGEKMKKFKEGASQLAVNVKTGMASMRDKLLDMRPNMLKRPWTWGKKTEEAPVEQEVKVEEPPYVPKDLNPGAILTITHDFLDNFKNMFVPEIFDVFLTDPLDLQLDFGFIVLDQLKLGFDRLDVREVRLEFVEEINAVNFHFPDTPLTVWISIVLKLPNGKTYTGKVHGEFYLDHPIIAVAFEEDPSNPYFAPKILLAIDDRFKIRDNDVNLRTGFPCMPNWLLNSIIWLFKNKINDAVTTYLKDSFMSGGSDLLF